MRYFQPLYVILLTTLLLSSCSKKMHPKSSEKSISTSINSFGFELYGQLVKESDENIFFSPLSISEALAMTQAGARGRTAETIAKVLHIDSNPMTTAQKIHRLNENLFKGDDSLKLSIANALWAQEDYDFLDSYISLVKEKYDASLDYINFGEAAQRETGRKKINSWVSKETKGNINELIGPNILSANTRLVLTNAIYFLGAWQQSFDPQLTVELPFTLREGENIMAYFMSRTTEAAVFINDELRILELAYNGKNLVMDIILPVRKDGLKRIEPLLTAENLDLWVNSLSTRAVVTLIPRWRSEFAFELGKPLIQMGMENAFGSGADFSGMSGKKDLFISKVLHKAFVEVNEKGTEAAAASAVIMAESIGSEPIDQVFFRADHPFIYLIRDRNTGTVLFIGRIMNPLN